MKFLVVVTPPSIHHLYYLPQTNVSDLKAMGKFTLDAEEPQLVADPKLRTNFVQKNILLVSQE